MLDYLEKNKDITSLSNFKTKANSKYYFEINSENDLIKLSEIYNYSLDNSLRILFVWAWTNMLFAFDNFDWIVIKNNLLGWTYNKETKILESYSNELISDIAESLENDYGQKLWHRFIGLPGSIGWAVYWNAGCFGLETENNFLEADTIELESGQMSTMSKIDMNFDYRTSILKQNNNRQFLIKARFNLSTLIEKYSSEVDNIDFRENKQPKGNTCGSFFKNPNREASAWYLIEQVWLKWHKVGWAFFSDKHANFLMSDWTASYKDLIELLELAQKKVKEKFDIELVNEVRIITN